MKTKRLNWLRFGSLGFILLGSSLCAASSAYADNSLYVIRGRRGVITFSSHKPTGGQNYSIFAPRNPAFSRFYSIGRKWIPRLVNSPFDTLIYSTAALYDLDPALVKAVVHVESAFNPEARSPKGAMGLMQLMPATAHRFGVDKPYTPAENVRGGVTYLKMLHDRYSGNVRLALAAYNAGEGRVDRIMEVPAISETQLYVKRVMRMKEIYTCALSGKKDCVS